MNRSRELLVVCLIIGLAIATAAFRTNSPTVSTSRASVAGSLTAAAPMLAPRSGHSATLLPDGRVLIAGGMRRNQDFYKSAELFDPATGRFQPTGEMNQRRVGHIAVLLASGKVLVAGGWVGEAGTDSAELYDPATGKFTLITKLTTPRGRPSATLLTNGDILIAGGEKQDNESLASAEIFHASTLTFQPTGSMHLARISHTATLLKDGRVLVAGGYSGGVASGAELYDPRSGAFSETGSMGTARCKHTAGLLPDGRVLVAGGSDSRGWDRNLNTTEIYDPPTGKFTAAAPMNDKRFKLPDEAVPLMSGRLLIAGGSKEAEIFKPEDGRFVAVAGQMNARWHYMSETRLRDGRVLLAGGYPDSDQATAQTWTYQP
jgi:hypothetical protein